MSGAGNLLAAYDLELGAVLRLELPIRVVPVLLKTYLVFPTVVKYKQDAPGSNGTS